MTPVGWEQLTALDRRFAAGLAISPHARGLRLIALLVAHSGDSLLGLVAAGAMFLGGMAWRGAALRIFLGTLVGGGIAALLKWLIRRPRPEGERGILYARLDRHGFPSGHAVRGAALVVLLAPLFPPWGWVALPLWAILVGLARIALGIHFPSDIVGGWGIGALAGALLSLGL